MHESIKNFTLEGIMAEANTQQTYETLLKEIHDWMRAEGYAPLDDIIPQFTRDYNPSSDAYDFKLTVYGAEVGERAWRISGISDGMTIERYTPSPR